MPFCCCCVIRAYSLLQTFLWHSFSPVLDYLSMPEICHLWSRTQSLEGDLLIFYAALNKEVKKIIWDWSNLYFIMSVPLWFLSCFFIRTRVKTIFWEFRHHMKKSTHKKKLSFSKVSEFLLGSFIFSLQFLFCMARISTQEGLSWFC